MQRIEYIQPSGTQFINAGINGASDISFEATYMESADTAAWKCLFGSRNTADNLHFGFYYSTSTAGNNVVMGKNGGHQNYDLTFNNLNKKITASYDATTSKLSVTDGTNVNVFQHNYTSSFTNTYNVLIFKMNDNNTTNPVDMASNVKLYHLKLWRGNTILRDFYPARDNNNNIGLYDTVSNTFFQNAGTGFFGAGPDIGATFNANENVMLTGQTAYFKKNGSMTNLGVITSNNQEITNNYGPGFIDEGSTIGIAELETSLDYINTLSDMELYLGDDFIDESEDYLVKANAENISTELSTRCTSIQNITSHIDKYSVLPFLKTKINTETLDMLIPISLTEDFVLEIKSDLNVVPNTSYMLIDDGGTFQLSQNSNGEFFLNGVSLGDISHNSGTTMVIVQENGHLYIEKDLQRLEVDVDIPGFSGNTNIVLNTQFAKILEYIKVYGTNGVTDELVPRYNTELRKAGLHDLQNNLWYTTTLHDITTHGDLYSYCEIWYGGMDLGYVPGPNTGIEIKYTQYYSQSTGTSTYRGIIGCMSGYSVPGTVSLGVILGYGSKIYAARNDNVVSWTDSNVANTVAGTSNWDVITVNKNNDGRFKCTGAHNFNIALSGTVTQQAPKGNTLWLNGFNDMGRYIPYDYINRYEIRGGTNDIYIGYVKIYEGDRLVRYYVPGYALSLAVNSNDRGMFDLVEQQFYKYNGNKCSFSCGGSIIEEPSLT